MAGDGFALELSTKGIVSYVNHTNSFHLMFGIAEVLTGMERKKMEGGVLTLSS